MNCPSVFIRDIKSIFNQGHIALLPVTSKSQLPVLELDVNPVTLRLLPCFLPKWRGKRRPVQRSWKIFTYRRKKPVQLSPTRDETASKVQIGLGSFSHHTLFKACYQLENYSHHLILGNSHQHQLELGRDILVLALEVEPLIAAKQL